MTTVAKTAKSQIQEYTLTSSASLLGLANELGKFIKDRNLCMNIQGKEYVLIEAWTYAGMSTGLCPVVTELTNESTDQEIKYRAVVELLNVHTSTVVGRGFAVCSNKEQGKKYFQEYAIASMAQTRATGKAYRLPLGWLMKAAGYEATPAEEMDFQSAEVVESKTAPAKKPSPAPVEKAQPEPEDQDMSESRKDLAIQLKELVLSNSEALGDDLVQEYTKIWENGTEQEIHKQLNGLKQSLSIPYEEVKYATAKQKEQIIRLLNNSVVTRLEKTKMLLNINKLDEERAEQAITNLKKVIGEREAEQSAAA